jgi:cyclophilin family peptidyl-prolyl cis-trans isomerase
VIQGGSPGANEYEGDGPFTRDEVGLLSHWRGTVGISTRGHDTGDGQIFVNLVDNLRLDHAYTIVGTVVQGMDVVDGVLEGARIERAEIVEGG